MSRAKGLAQYSTDTTASALPLNGVDLLVESAGSEEVGGRKEESKAPHLSV